MNPQEEDYLALISGARHPDDIATLALSGVIAMRHLRKSPYDVPIAGLNKNELVVIRQMYFPTSSLRFDQMSFDISLRDRLDEFDDLLSLLMDHRSLVDQKSRWLAHAVATASMGDNHLWEDMGLPSRATLSQLMSEYFAPIASRNVNDMKWKKFFYRQLCERAGLTICRSPSCCVCSDFLNCFDPEESASGHFLITA
jgi:nitrogen fixation protein NifQ